MKTNGRHWFGVAMDGDGTDFAPSGYSGFKPGPGYVFDLNEAKKHRAELEATGDYENLVIIMYSEIVID